MKEEESCIEADTLRELGAIELDAHNNELAVSYLQKALSLYKEKNLLYGQATVFNDLGIIHYNQDDFARAKAFFMDSRRLYQQLGLQSREANVLGNLANAEMYLGNLEISNSKNNRRMVTLAATTASLTMQ